MEFSPPRAARVSVHPWPIRALALILSLLLSLTSSAPLMAITMGQIKAGVAAGSAGGGEGAAPNLQNAGAASAALTAALTKKSQQQSAAVVAAMQKLQAQATAAAKANPATVLPNGQTVNGDTTVYNGLKAGWLEPYVGKNADGSLKSGFDANGNPITDPKNGGTWSGASITPSPVAANAANPNYVNIKQSAQNAYLYWNQFNVGPSTTVNFDQSSGGQNAGNWIAFNKVMSPSDPSHIFGTITAQGQVYILNQNGILFHGGSVVNTHSLVASTLPINVNLAGDALDGVTGRGIANNPSAQFLFTSFSVPSDNQDKNGFDPAKTAYGVSSSPGDVVVEKGASIVSPVNDAGVGGLVALVAPNVRNEGSISTAAGQTILAAGLQVALIPHPSADPSLRGMDVTIGLVGDSASAINPLNTPLNGTAGSVINNGLVSAPVGDITLAGKGISLGSIADDVSSPVNGGKQIGAVLDSATSVSLNGRIDLIASSGATKNTSYGIIGPAYIQGSTGLIDIGQGSVLQILPEWFANSSVVGASLALNSIVDFIGQSIHVGQNAILEIPGAVVTPGSLSEEGQSLTSGISLHAGQWFNSRSPSSSSSPSQLLATEGQIYLESGSIIDASGSTGVTVDSLQNFLTLQLRGPELANSPLQRDNLTIRGKDITVDGRIAGTADGKVLYFPTVAEAFAAYQAGKVAWIGTPLGNASGFAGLIQRGVAQMTEQGGTVSLSAGDSIVMQAGSSVNVSGGWTQYSGGNVATTKLLTADGRIVDISKATPDQVYAGIVKIASSVYEAPYIQGAAGGSLSIAAPAMALQGDLYGVTVTGARQLRTSATTSMLPGLSSLNLSFQGEALMKNLAGGFSPVTVSSPVPPMVMFSDASLPAAPAFSIDSGTGLPTALVGSLSPEVPLSPSLVSSRGFGKLGITDHDGVVVLPSGVTLDFPALGSLTISASSIDVSGSIYAPGGSVSLTADLVPFGLANSQMLIQDGVLSQPFLGVLVAKDTANGLTQGEQVFQYGQPDENGNQAVFDATGAEFVVSGSQLESSSGGTVSIARGSSISTAGLLVNDGFHSSLAESRPAILNGGTITLSASHVSLSQGSLLDVSGGALLPSTGKGVSYGKGGALTVAAGIDPENSQMASGSIDLGATLRGYSGPGSAAGSLSLGAPAFQIGGSTAPSGVLLLQPSFFDQGGFSSLSLIGSGIPDASNPGDYLPGVLVSQGTLIHPVITSQILESGGGGVLLTPWIQPYGYAPAASLSFAAMGVKDSFPTGQNLLVRGDVVLDQGASITIDPQIKLNGSSVSAYGGAVSLAGMTASVQGAIIVPGGSIMISGTKGNFPVNYSDLSDPAVNAPRVTVDIGPKAVLSTAGECLIASDPLGLRPLFGTVLPGGRIVVSGDIIAESGAVFDASGASGMLDLSQSQTGQSGITRARVDSAGGSISLIGGNALYSDATLIAKAGGAQALGGVLTLSSGRFYDGGSSANPWDTTLALSQSASATPAEFGFSGTASIGQALPVSFGIPEGGGHLSVSSFSQGGFDSITMKGNIQFATFGQDLLLSVPGTLSLADQGILNADGSVLLSAGYVSLGGAFLPPLQRNQGVPLQLPAPSSGPGSLSIKARLMDVGSLSLQGVDTASLDTGSGLIRGDGSLEIAGDLTLRAGWVFPVTGTTFLINAASGDVSDGSITIKNGGGNTLLPLSAEGSLSLYAHTISQGGNIAAPLGNLSLGWNGAGSALIDPVTGNPVQSATSVSLLAGSVTTVSGIDPSTGKSISVPYGTSSDGSDWIDPSGAAITSTGVAGKQVTLSGQNLVTEANSIVDVSGGGSLYASQWVSGLGGTINYLSATSGSYAILPGAQALAAPTRYGDGSLAVGQQVYLPGISGLPAGYYTLLPAIYATQPGAYLITPSSKTLGSGSFQNPDGSWLVSGGYGNALDSSSLGPIRQTFKVDPPSVIAGEVQYQTYAADTFFSGLSSSARTTDGGHLLIQGDSGMTLAGSINGTASGAARGSAIDISSTTAIWIGPSAGQGNAPSGDIVLTDSVLSGWNVASLLVGGTRGTPASDGSTPITVTTTSVTVDDGSTLNGNDLIFAAAEGIFIGQGVSLKASGSQVIPDKQVAISGDGVALRISSDGSVGIARSAVSSLASQTGMTDANGNTFTPTLAIGSSVDPDGTSPVPLGSITTLTGAGMVADSSNLSSIGQNVNFSPASSHGSLSVTLNAGSIALLMGEGESSANLDVSDASSLTLKGATLQNATSLSLGSYSAISFYGAGGLQSPGLKNLALHAAELRGFDLSGGAIALSSSGDLLIDNVMAGTSPGAVSASPNGGSLPDGSLQLGGSRILLGTGSVAIDQFASVVLNASSGIYAKESGALGVGSQSMPSDLVLDSPLLSTLGMAPSFAIISSGSCHLQNSSANSANASSAGNGGKLLLTAGNGMTLDSSILLPSGSVVVETLFGDLAIGGSSLAKISVAGATKDFNGKLQTADAGSISLISDGGNVVLGSGSSIDLSAQGASSGGSLTVIAPVGSLKMTTDPDSGQFVLKANASGGSNGGAGGAFSLDAMVINNSDLVDSGSPSLLSSIVPQLTAAGFTDSLAFRIRSGDVAVDTIVKAHSVCISADDPNQSFGTIEVTGTGSIDASGTTGGNIVLQASGSVILDPGSSLAVHGLNYDAAGKGGAIFLSAGAEINGQINPNAVLDLQSGSALDLGVTVPGRVIGTDPNTGLPETDQFQGMLHLRAPVSFDESGNPTGIQIRAFDSTLASVTHQVSGEDTVASVASLFGINSVQLILANNLVTTAPLQDGITLKSSLAPDAQTYTVDATNNGDTVDSVAAALGITPAQLTAYNNLPISLAAGTTLKSVNVSNIAVEGYRLYDLTTDGSPGDIASVSSQAVSDAQIFLGSPGTYSDTAAAIINRLGTKLSPAEGSLINLSPGVEIINRQGGLMLSQYSDWDLSQFRTGGNLAPGFLTLRAFGSIILNASLSDGFASSDYASTLLPRNVALPGNFQSWSYSIAAGADLSSAKLNAVLRGTSANVELGIPYAGGGSNILPNGVISKPNGPDGQTSSAIDGYYQVIRTGTGDISINASGDLHLWNQFASIYTAGTQVLDPTLGGTFDIPLPSFASQSEVGLGASQQSTPSVQYSYGGGNIAVNVGGNIQHLAWQGDGQGNVITDPNTGNPVVIADSVWQMPSNWLYRRGALDPSTGNFLNMPQTGDLASTSWWVDFSNFFEGIGALGGGNITMNAGGTIANVDAVIPTNFRMPGRDSSGNTVQAGLLAGIELGGGNLVVRTGENLDAGVYYVESGKGVLRSGGNIITNPTRDPVSPTVTGAVPSLPQSYLPTTLFLGDSSFQIQAAGNITLGPLANVFLTPEGNNNGYPYQAYFSTYAASSKVSVTSLGGQVCVREEAATAVDTGPLLRIWYDQTTPPLVTSQNLLSYYQPWNWSDVYSVGDLGTQLSILPPSLAVSAFSGGIVLQGNLNLAPSKVGNLSLFSSEGIVGLTMIGSSDGFHPSWMASTINLSDADPSKIPGINTPSSMISTLQGSSQTDPSNYADFASSFVSGISSLFLETGSFTGQNAVLENKLNLHASVPLHAGDLEPLNITALNGDVSGFELFSSKRAEISASGSITDVGLYIQNVAASDLSIITAGNNIIPYDQTSFSQLQANQNLKEYGLSQLAPIQSGDIQISGPGTLEVLAGGNIDLGNGPNNADGTGVGITSIGNSRNPSLGFEGANLITAAGLSLPTGLAGDLNNAKALLSRSATMPDAGNYYAELLTQIAQGGDDDLAAALKKAGSLDDISGSAAITDDQKSRLAVALFYIVLRDSGRDHNNPDAASYGSYQNGRDAIASFLKGAGNGNIFLRTQSIRTLNGGSISMIAPNGGVSLAGVIPPTLNAITPPGIVSEHGGSIDIYTRNDVSIGIGRIFTLRGGDIMIWSDQGNIAAGSSAKTVATAPPTRVLIDPQSGNVQTDLAGLATGGGIGVLDTVVGLPPGNVDLIAPSGIIDAGDAGIRSSGTLNLAATAILNADNIAAAVTVGAPPATASAAPVPAAPPAAAPPSAANTAAAANNSGSQTASKNNAGSQGDETPSIFSIDILGYGGGDGDDEEKSKAADATVAPVQASL